MFGESGRSVVHEVERDRPSVAPQPYYSGVVLSNRRKWLNWS
jgi:hypothetical protein